MRLVTALPWLAPVMRYGGALFLAAYGLRSLWAAWRNSSGLNPAADERKSLSATILTCLAFTWLNPHVYLDTVVLLGSISTGYAGQRVAFAAGASTSSVLFFFALGYGARLLRPLFANPRAWRVLDVLHRHHDAGAGGEAGDRELSRNRRTRASFLLHARQQNAAMIRIGTAGWSIPAAYRSRFPDSGSQLEKYAARLTAVEINSSFYRPHRRATYERWAASVPADFRFAVKLPRTITQDSRLQDYGDLLDRFLAEASGLGDKLGVLLVQLPPKLVYDEAVAMAFFQRPRPRRIPVACEPRHPSWFTPQADDTLRQLGVARVAADPPRAPSDGEPGGNRGFAYWRLHGSPRIYYSDYGEEALARLAGRLQENDWCIFDNTAAYHALGNALRLRELTTR